MNIGGYAMYPVESGRFRLDGGAMFGVVPKTLWEKSNPADERNRIAMVARALLLVGDDRKVLIDAGNGSKMSEKLKRIYGIDNSQSSLESSLLTYNVTPADITDVILTHLHFDHAGGATILDEGEVRPAFPNAVYYVQHEQWKAALHPTERDRASFFQDDFLPLRDYGVLELTDGEGEILPGIEVKIFQGHTTALQAPFMTDGTTSLFFCADLIPLAAHVQLPWIMGYDLRPLVTLEEKRTILKSAEEDRWILFFEHDPSLTAGRVRRGENGFEMESAVELD